MTRELPLILACLCTLSATGQSLLLNTRLQPETILESGDSLSLDLHDFFQSYPSPGPVATFTIRMPVQDGLHVFDIDGTQIELMRYRLQSGEAYEDPRSVSPTEFEWKEEVIQFQLFGDEAPVTVANFMTYANDGAYQNTIIHRNESTGVVYSASGVLNFNPIPIIQTGGFRLYDTDQYTLEWIRTLQPIPLEQNLANTQGTLAMARTAALDSATSQFFVNLEDNSAIFNERNPYAVFGELLSPESGQAVLDEFADTFVMDLTIFFPQLPFQSIPFYAYNPFDEKLNKDSYVRFQSIAVESGDPEGVSYSFDFVDDDDEVSDAEAANRAAFDIRFEGSNLLVDRVDTGLVTIEVTGTKGGETASFTVDLTAFNAGALERFPGSEIKQDGILETIWYGELIADSAAYTYPSIYHFNHGPQYVADTSSQANNVTSPISVSDIYLYDYSLDSWIYSNTNAYPVIFQYSLGQWIYYAEGTGDGGTERIFYLYEEAEPGWFYHSGSEGGFMRIPSETNQ